MARRPDFPKVTVRLKRDDPPILAHVEVDGMEIHVTRFSFEGSASNLVKVTLEFPARLYIEDEPD